MWNSDLLLHGINQWKKLRFQEFNYLAYCFSYFTMWRKKWIINRWRGMYKLWHSEDLQHIRKVSDFGPNSHYCMIGASQIIYSALKNLFMDFSVSQWLLWTKTLYLIFFSTIFWLRLAKRVYCGLVAYKIRKCTCLEYLFAWDASCARNERSSFPWKSMSSQMQENLSKGKFAVIAIVPRIEQK